MVCPTALPANNAAAAAAMKNVLFMVTPRFSSGLKGNSAHRQVFHTWEEVGKPLRVTIMNIQRCFVLAFHYLTYR
jgi:hypothetical protein